MSLDKDVAAFMGCVNINSIIKSKALTIIRHDEDIEKTRKLIEFIDEHQDSFLVSVLLFIYQGVTYFFVSMRNDFLNKSTRLVMFLQNSLNQFAPLTLCVQL